MTNLLQQGYNVDDNNDPGRSNSTTSTSSRLALVGLHLFLLSMTGIVLWNFSNLFLARHGLSHRFLGGVHFLWLIVGAVCTASMTSMSTLTSANLPYWHAWFLYYDVIILGLLGIFATLIAAKDFPHKYVANKIGQSGTLHRQAMVTQGEMIEHSYYQFINLWQALYLYALSYCENLLPLRIGLLWLVTAPWLFRQKIPVHRFSHNWTLYQKQKQKERHQRQNGHSNEHTEKYNHDKEEVDHEVFLYRIKKAQYLFYKHVILHGVNISLAVRVHVQQQLSKPLTIADTKIPFSSSWRVFWLSLNMSYVMEFFLQTLVKRQMLNQSTMLWLQRGLMAASSLAAFAVLHDIDPMICVFSLLFNFVNRHHDVWNTMAIACFTIVWYRWNGYHSWK